MLFFILAATAARAVPMPRNVHDRIAVEHYMRVCEENWAALDVDRDPAAVRDCIADDYEGVSSHQEKMSKAIATDPGPGPSDTVSAHVDYVHYRFPAPNVAIAQGAETAIHRDGHKRSVIWHDIWLLRKGRWQIVASQDSLLTTDKSKQE